MRTSGCELTPHPFPSPQGEGWFAVYQIIGRETLWFDDRVVAAEALAGR
ncbi:MAG: hypothetical protein ACKVQS_06080 [Fimbriimonadaceae bacterium]